MSDDIEQIKSDIRDIRNDIEKIKGEIMNLNRTNVIINSPIIEEDIKKIIGSASRLVQIVQLTKDPMTLDDLVNKTGVSKSHVYRYLNPFLVKSYIYRQKIDSQVYYLRAEIFDLIGFDNNPDFTNLLKE